MRYQLFRSIIISGFAHLGILGVVFASSNLFNSNSVNLNFDVAYNFVPLGSNSEKDKGMKYLTNTDGEGKQSSAAKAQRKGEMNGMKNVREYYMSKNKHILAAQIQNLLLYPHVARMRGYCGTAHISFILTESGSVTEIKLLKSSGYSILDESAIKTIASLTGLPKPRQPIELHIPIKYSIDD